ncbi:peptidase family C50-domain-containing protein [Mucor mucedo]|uniref:peptidase family C50-domain-containing protein n=1 Tax=Mucor mucedo TaxID=29922 RepID=UPI0022206D80|nr:peptidase family C50-domain-containing protein [Mucor mucedo]KAI7873956.1 peptidase family C50-domain-containing protein [Mucor mucedo]
MQNCLKLKTKRSQPPNDKNWPSDSNRAPTFFEFELGWLEAHLNTLTTMYTDEKDLEITDFQDKYINIIPNNWTVCSLTYDPINQDLYAVRMRTGETPYVVKIPLNRCKHRSKFHSVIKYDEALSEFQDIIAGSDETIQNSSSCNDPTEVEDWWNARRDLDDRMRNLLNSIENQWFSGFKGILGGRTFECVSELQNLQKTLSEFAYKMMYSASNKLKQVELDINFCRMIVRLGPKPNPRDLEDLAYFVLSRYEAQDAELDHSKLDMKKMADQMKLLNIRYYDASRRAGIDPNKIVPNDHVILILDKHLQMFPVESTPILFKQSVSRLPCLSFLRDRILYARAHATRTSGTTNKNKTEWKDLSVSKKSAFYVLNPSGDLKDTQKVFEPIFNNIPEWSGVTEAMPMELQCRDALQNRDIYMYFGHSAGQSFMRGTSVRQLPKCAVSLLMGCSSGVLESNGEFDPHGYVLNYLLAGR